MQKSFADKSKIVKVPYSPITTVIAVSTDEKTSISDGMQAPSPTPSAVAAAENAEMKTKDVIEFVIANANANTNVDSTSTDEFIDSTISVAEATTLAKCFESSDEASLAYEKMKVEEERKGMGMVFNERAYNAACGGLRICAIHLKTQKAQIASDVTIILKPPMIVLPARIFITEAASSTVIV